MKNSLRETYNALYRYFGLRSLDGFVAQANGEKKQEQKKSSELSLAESNVYNALFADSTYNPSIGEICKYIEEMKIENSKNMFCITPFDDNDIPETSDRNQIPLNDSSITNFKDQGIYGTDYKKDPDKTKPFNVQDMNPDKFKDASGSGLGRVDVIQVFPISKSPELADADVLSLYMSNINTINMSRAVPFVEISIGSEGSAGDSSSRPFSLGKFLSFSPRGVADPVLDAEFENDPLKSQRSVAGKDGSAKNFNTRTVASMEVFTTPQTLVNASPENIRYNENSQAGRHFDIFRPFLNLESLAIHVLPSGAGTIALKTADMKIRLFDRGRLGEIASIISPSKFGVVKFDIEYGWSHPSGNKVSRRSDADADRIGDLIDAMRIRETYQLVNSSVNFEQDGTVAIDIKLTMHSTNSLNEATIKFADEHDTAEINQILKNMQQLIAIKPANVNVPAILTGNADTFLSMTKEQKQELEKFIAQAKNGGSGSLAGLAKAAAGLLYGPNKKSPTVVEKFQETRRNALKTYIKNLRKNPDPFLRREGLSGGELGVTSKEIESGDYASLGAILVTIMGEILRQDGDVIFIFGSFNRDAGAMYDHNIAQFPIKISSGEKSKSVELYTVLEKKLTTMSKISPQALFQTINEEFILRESSEAYGLTQLYDLPQYRVGKDGKEDEKKDKVKIALAKGDEDENSAGNQLLIEEKKIANLKAIYGADKRVRPNFTLPRLNIKIDSKPPENGESKNVIRVLITDQMANNVGDAMQLFNDSLTKGFFVNDSAGYAGPDSTNARSAKHNDVFQRVLSELEGLHLTKKYDGGSGNLLNDVLGGPLKDLTIEAKKKDELEKLLDRVLVIDSLKDVTSNMKLRDVFFRNYPSIIYGSQGSGIIAASLSTQQNAALTTIAIQRQGNSEDANPNLPMMIHPTQLSLEVFGSPLFKYTQKFFIDFGTGTSADNFYAVTGIDMDLSPTDYKCNLKMTQIDSYGGMMKLSDTIIDNIVSTLQLQNFQKQTPPSSGGKGKGGKKADKKAEDEASKKLEADAQKSKENSASKK